MRKIFYSIIFLLLPWQAYASFIESTMGTAVVNDAVATYYNPAALVQLKNPQIVALNSLSIFHSRLSGSVTTLASGNIQSGVSTATNQYYLPAIYFAMPISDKMRAGVAVIANDVNRDIEGNSNLRYLQSNNSIQDIDVVPAFSFKINNVIAIGAGLIISRANFLMQPVYGIPSATIPDSQSRNESSGMSWGGDIGLFIKPNERTSLGFNYRNSMTYHMSGTSSLNSQPELQSRGYHFDYWIPARSVFSINHFITQKFGIIGTIQYIQWNIFKNVRAYNVAVPINNQPTIVPVVVSPYHFHNSWLFTLGNHYRMTPKWVLRFAGSYIQSPSDGNYQIDNGNIIIIGASTGYRLSKKILIDGGYAHAFVQNKNIHIISTSRTINGVNQNAGNGFSLKLTIDL